MEEITTIGLDLAKNIFRAHGSDSVEDNLSFLNCIDRLTDNGMILLIVK